MDDEQARARELQYRVARPYALFVYGLTAALLLLMCGVAVFR